MAKAVASTRAMEVQLGRTSASGKAAQGALAGMGKGSMLAMGGATLGAYALVKGLSSATNAAIDFESSFAGIRKTVDATEEEFQVLEEGMRNLATEIPVAVDELNRIGELGGQLGIAKENLIDFTATVAKIAVTTDLTVEDAAMRFAQFAEITQMPQDRFENLASTVVDLGNNFATTESMIVEYGQRLAGAGEIAGMTEADIMAIGTAAASVGVQAEAGGTAIQKVILKMTESVELGDDKLEKFAETAGMTADEFVAKWNKNPAAAFTRFIEGLGKEGRAGIGTLKELGLTDQRLTRSFLSLAGAGDVVRRSIKLGNNAFEEANALQEEAAKRFATTEQKILLAKNQIHDLKITAGESTALALGNAAQTLTEVLKAPQRIEESFTASERLMVEFARAAGEGRLTLEEFGAKAEAVAGEYKDWWNAGGLIDDERAETLEKLRLRLEGFVKSGMSGAEILKELGIASEGAGEKTEKGGKKMAAGGKHAEQAARGFAKLFETQDGFVDWRDSAMSSLGDISGAFGELASEARVTADEILHAFEHQIAATRYFKENLNVLISRGAKPQLIQDLIDMGDEGARWAKALADANEETTKAFFEARRQNERELLGLTGAVQKADRNIGQSMGSIGREVKKNESDWQGWERSSSESINNVARDLEDLWHLVEKGAAPGTVKAEAQGMGSPTAPGIFGGTPTAWAVAAMNAVPGPQSIMSGHRPLDTDSFHSTPPPHNAVDIGGSNLYATFAWLAAQYGQQARELIYGHAIIEKGRYGYYAPNDHWDHVHLADMGKIVEGPAWIRQGNITEAHIPLSGSGSGAVEDMLERAFSKALQRGGRLHADLYVGSERIAKDVVLHNGRNKILLGGR